MQQDNSSRITLETRAVVQALGRSRIVKQVTIFGLAHHRIMAFELTSHPRTCTAFLLHHLARCLASRRTTAKEPRDFYAAMQVVQACVEIVWAARANPNSQLIVLGA